MSFEESRLARLFARVLPVVLALPAVAACSTSRTPAPDAGAPADPCKPKLTSVFFGRVDGADECRARQSLACGLPEGVTLLDAGCQIRPADCLSICPSFGAFSCEVADASCPAGQVVRDGPVSVVCDFCPGGIGRRPAKHVELDVRSGTGPLAEYLERAAYLEGASVRAFAELFVALAAAGAPPALLDECAHAARDELRHFRAMVRLSRRFGGGAPCRPREARSKGVHPAPVSIDALALQNALEGCVRETYGALLASFQAKRAGDAVVRSAMAAIAADETRHAALSWAIARWSAPHISGGAARALEGVLSAGVRELYSQVREPHEDLALFLGLPTSGEQRRLLEHLEAHRWS